jgi:ferric-dicitrate binding protein FerR (iron transport regulator)
MSQRHEYIASLINGYNNGDLTAQQDQELTVWLAESDENKKLFQELTDPETLRNYLRQMEGYDEKSSWEKIKPATPVLSMRSRLWRRIAVAASIVFLLGIGSYFVIARIRQQAETKQSDQTITVHDVKAPEKNRAMITLSDGKRVFLDSAKNGSLAIQGNINVLKTADGQIVYESGNRQPVSGIQYNTLTNPRGSKVIDMTLSDGSHVWLNAGSSVTYPVAFVGNERKVSMKGEAYFEVTHSVTASGAKQSFIVKKGDAEIEVLGTHFNVNAFDDEENIKVTLLEGSVKVSQLTTHSSQFIKPGEQAVIARDEAISTHNSSSIRVIRDADLDAVMAWKNGRFDYHNSDLETIMRQMARWYDVDVEYKDRINDKYTVDVSREVPVSQLFRFIEMSGGVHFDIEGRKITVKK